MPHVILVLYLVMLVKSKIFRNGSMKDPPWHNSSKTTWLGLNPEWSSSKTVTGKKESLMWGTGGLSSFNHTFNNQYNTEPIRNWASSTLGLIWCFNELGRWHINCNYLQQAKCTQCSMFLFWRRLYLHMFILQLMNTFLSSHWRLQPHPTRYVTLNCVRLVTLAFPLLWFSGTLGHPNGRSGRRPIHCELGVLAISHRLGGAPLLKEGGMSRPIIGPSMTSTRCYEF
jgi:hypothetical protein